MPISFNTEHRPVLLAVEHGRVADDELAELLELMRVELERARITGLRVVAILDATTKTKLHAHHRQMRVEWIAKHDQLIAETMVGIVLVTQSALLRGAILAQNLLHKPAVPQKTAVTVDDALEQARSLLATHNLELPDALLRDGARILGRS